MAMFQRTKTEIPVAQNASRASRGSLRAAAIAEYLGRTPSRADLDVIAPVPPFVRLVTD
ncbi:hypothetical protein [Verrucosispora sp. WMMD573]|uniref:hypothetical protein n=1 Tax=Verrucosispora sp. WMMD573 TaxID=3015149 RepID=UPI00248C7B01|nr:hypothetical protein [Verrucosispora sp. WMMD573]WBB53648.1 hypothetical protein O7601_24275 [Verrucosispora sp. WMMD573]